MAYRHLAAPIIGSVLILVGTACGGSGDSRGTPEGGESDVQGTDSKQTEVIDSTDVVDTESAGDSGGEGALDTAGAQDSTENDFEAPPSDVDVDADTLEPLDIADTSDVTTGCTPNGGEVVKLTTEDGVELEGDLYTTGALGGPGVVLLHMIPPFHDRTSYPKEFIDALVARGITVLNLDRRGAGASGGVPEDAYLGELGKWDARAAVESLSILTCGPDPNRIGLVGASNGTTTALDYAVWAWGEAAVRPSALVFLSAGEYTANQHPLADAATLFGEELPIAFHYPVNEATFNESLATDAPAPWTFTEHDPGAHGTGLFDTNPEIVEEIGDFLATEL